MPYFFRKQAKVEAVHVVTENNENSNGSPQKEAQTDEAKVFFNFNCYSFNPSMFPFVAFFHFFAAKVLRV